MLAQVWGSVRNAGNDPGCGAAHGLLALRRGSIGKLCAFPCIPASCEGGIWVESLPVLVGTDQAELKPRGWAWLENSFPSPALLQFNPWLAFGIRKYLI